MTERESVPAEAVRAGIIALHANERVHVPRHDRDYFEFRGSYADVCCLVEEIYTAMRKEMKHEADGKDNGRA